MIEHVTITIDRVSPKYCHKLTIKEGISPYQRPCHTAESHEWHDDITWNVADSTLAIPCGSTGEDQRRQHLTRNAVALLESGSVSWMCRHETSSTPRFHHDGAIGYPHRRRWSATPPETLHAENRQSPPSTRSFPADILSRQRRKFAILANQVTEGCCRSMTANGNASKAHGVLVLWGDVIPAWRKAGRSGDAAGSIDFMRAWNVTVEGRNK